MERGPSDLTLSPFWAAVRRRRPDVDLVLLADEQATAPTPAAAPESTGAFSPAEITAALERVRAYANGAWALAVGDGRLLEPELGYGTAEHTVRAQVRAAAPVVASPMARLEHDLLDAGWSTARPPASTELLLARRGDVDLRATYAGTGAFALTVRSAAYDVGVERARELVRS